MTDGGFCIFRWRSAALRWSAPRGTVRSISPVEGSVHAQTQGFARGWEGLIDGQIG
jgi:hypothetical protein